MITALLNYNLGVSLGIKPKEKFDCSSKLISKN